MTKKHFLLAFFFIWSFQIYAQPGAENPKIKEVRASLVKDVSYTKFQLQLKDILKTATGKQTNAVAVKKLFSENKILLQNLKTKYPFPDLPPDTSFSAFRFFNTSRLDKQTKEELLKLKNKEKLFVEKYPAYQQKLNYLKPGVYASNNGPNCHINETATDESLGKIAFVVDDHSMCWGTPAYVGFQQDFEVPTAPDILAAKISLDYSFTLNGWDSHFGQQSIELEFYASNNFVSTGFRSLPHCYGCNESEPGIWKLATMLMPLTSVKEDFTEYHIQKDSTLSFLGYVTPGTQLHFKIAAGFPWRNAAPYGTYQYAEFIVKKITISFMKSATESGD